MKRFAFWLVLACGLAGAGFAIGSSAQSHGLSAMAAGGTLLLIISFAAAAATILEGWARARRAGRSVSAEERAKQEARLLEPRDALTGLPGRQTFMSRLEVLAMDAPSDGSAALVCLDVVEFPVLVRQHGAAAGDLLLRHMTARLLARLREDDLLTRTTRSRFVVLLMNADTPEGIEKVCARLQAAMREPFDLMGQSAAASLAFGAVMVTGEPDELDRLLEEAERALDAARDGGPEKLRFADPRWNEALMARAKLAFDLPRALAAGEIDVWYEPAFDPQSRRLIELSAVLQWPHPRLGVVQQGRIMEAAAQTGLVADVCDQLVSRALSTLATWRRQQLPGLRLHIVLPAQLIGDNTFFRHVQAGLETSGVPAAALTLGLDEETAATLRHPAVTWLHAVSTSGVRLSLERFGGHDGALVRLQRLPLSRLTIALDSKARPAVPALDAALTLAVQLDMEAALSGVTDPQQIPVLAGGGARLVRGPALAATASLAETDAIVRGASWRATTRAEAR